MPLFDDPVEVTIHGEPALWLGCEATDHVWAIVVGPSGNVSTVTPSSLVANFRLVDGRWMNADDADLQRAMRETDAAVAGEAALKGLTGSGARTKYPEGTIFDKEGNPYTADGDPL